MVASTLSGKKKFFLIAGVLSFLLLLPITGTALSPKQSSTRIVLDTPVREVNYNDTIVFKGKLINALDNNGITSTPITIYHKGLQKNHLLVTGETDANGYFQISWVAKPVEPLSNVVNVFAAFDGNVEYKPARTFEYSVNIVTKYSIDIRADKQFYYVGDKAVITVKIAGPTNNLFDPTDMHSFLDGMMVSMNRIDAGHYRYFSKELTHGIHNFSVNVKIPSPESKFRADFNTVSSSGQIHVIKRPTTMTANVNDDIYFMNDEIVFDATLLDVVRGGYITDQNLTAYLTLPDETIRAITLSPLGNTYTGKYLVNETDSVGLWTASVKFDGDYALQPSDFPLGFLKVNDYRVKPSVVQQGNVTTINFMNHEDNDIDVYEVVVKLNEESIISTRAPSEWTLSVDASTNTIYFSTDTKPLKPEKALEFQIETAELIQSFTWEIRDIDSNAILAGKYPNL
jgi:hypothetical protein